MHIINIIHKIGNMNVHRFADIYRDGHGGSGNTVTKLPLMGFCYKCYSLGEINKRITFDTLNPKSDD